MWYQDKFSKEWVEARILKVLEQLKSYLVIKNKNQLVRRNSISIKRKSSFKHDIENNILIKIMRLKVKRLIMMIFLLRKIMF